MSCAHVRLLMRIVLLCAALCLPQVVLSDDADRRMSIGLNGISDWSTQHPFIDLMKTARPWIGHLPGQWGGVTFEELQTRGAIASDGWPTSVPPETRFLEALILTDQPKDAVHLKGQYHVLYEGQGRLEVTGRARVTRRDDGHQIFTYTPGEGLVGLRITETDASDPIRNIRVIKDEHLELAEAGAVFNPLWTEKLEGFDTVRFMDWMLTNNSTVVDWDDLPTASDFSYAWRGVPLEVMVALANEIDAHPWFNMPHLASDALVQQYAAEVFATLEPELVAHVEYSNEVWNFIFEQARWAGQQAEALWGDLGDGWMQFYGLRAAQVMEIWTDVYGDAATDQLNRVAGMHTGWPGLEEAVLQGEQVREALGGNPVDLFDAYAVTGYFGYELSDPDASEAMLDAAEARARTAGEAEGLQRVALREYVRERQFEGTFVDAAVMMRSGSFRELTEELWPYHARVAASHGLELLMYEGGTHAAADWEAADNERLVEFLNAFNYSDEMGALYEDAFAAFEEIGGTSFNVFVDVAPLSKWGSWGALRHLNDDNPRWRAVQSYVATPSE